MVDGRCREAWDHTASLMLIVASIVAGKNSRPKLADFHPYMRQEQAPKKNGMAVLFAIAKAKGNRQALAAALKRTE